jgi:hypothetical protein
VKKSGRAKPTNVSDWSPKQLEDFFASREAEGDEEHFADRFFLKPAQEDGDWKALANYFDNGGPLTLAMRRFLADVLRGAKRKKHAPKKSTMPARQLMIGGFVEHLERQNAHDPIRRAMTVFDVSRSTVKTAKHKFEKCEPADREFVLMSRRLRELIHKTNK